MCWQVVYILLEYHSHDITLWMVLKIFSRWWNDFYVSWKVKVNSKRTDPELILLWLFEEMKSLIILWKYFCGSDKLLESTSQSNISVSRCKQCVYILLEYHSQSNILWIVFTLLYQRYVSVILLSTPFLHLRNTLVWLTVIIYKMMIHIDSVMNIIAEILSCEWWNVTVTQLLFACKKGVDKLYTLIEHHCKDISCEWMSILICHCEHTAQYTQSDMSDTLCTQSKYNVNT